MHFETGDELVIKFRFLTPHRHGQTLNNTNLHQLSSDKIVSKCNSAVFWEGTIQILS